MAADTVIDEADTFLKNSDKLRRTSQQRSPALHRLCHSHRRRGPRAQAISHLGAQGGSAYWQAAGDPGEPRHSYRAAPQDGVRKCRTASFGPPLIIWNHFAARPPAGSRITPSTYGKRRPGDARGAVGQGRRQLAASDCRCRSGRWRVADARPADCPGARGAQRAAGRHHAARRYISASSSRMTSTSFFRWRWLGSCRRWRTLPGLSRITASPLPRHRLRSCSKFGIGPGTIRRGNGMAKGYKLKDFGDAFMRYVPESSITPSQVNEINGLQLDGGITPASVVTDQMGQKLNNSGRCDGVTAKNQGGEQQPEGMRASRRTRVVHTTMAAPMPETGEAQTVRSVRTAAEIQSVNGIAHQIADGCDRRTIAAANRYDRPRQPLDIERCDRCGRCGHKLSSNSAWDKSWHECLHGAVMSAAGA